MKYLFILCLFWACLSSYTYAESKQDITIMGHVIDKKTKEHFPYVTIYLKGTTLGTTTDATGHYFLKNLPEGLQMKDQRFFQFEIFLLQA